MKIIRKMLFSIIYIKIFNSGFWFRIFGYGVKVRDISIYPPLFSERNGYQKKLQVGNWRATYLGK